MGQGTDRINIQRTKKQIIHSANEQMTLTDTDQRMKQ